MKLFKRTPKPPTCIKCMSTRFYYEPCLSSGFWRCWECGFLDWGK